MCRGLHWKERLQRRLSLVMLVALAVAAFWFDRPAFAQRASQPSVKIAYSAISPIFAWLSDVSVQDFFDNSIVDRMVQEGFVEQLYKGGGK